MLTALPKVRIPRVDGRSVKRTEAALLCALMHFREGRVAPAQRNQLIWLARRYLCEWVTPRRFFGGRDDNDSRLGKVLRKLCTGDVGALLQRDLFGDVSFSSAGAHVSAVLRDALPPLMSAAEYSNHRAGYRIRSTGRFAP